MHLYILALLNKSFILVTKFTLLLVTLNNQQEFVTLIDTKLYDNRNGPKTLPVLRNVVLQGLFRALSRNGAVVKVGSARSERFNFKCSGWMTSLREFRMPQNTDSIVQLFHSHFMLLVQSAFSLHMQMQRHKTHMHQCTIHDNNRGWLYVQPMKKYVFPVSKPTCSYVKNSLFFVLYLDEFFPRKSETYEFVCFRRGPFYRRTLLARFIPNLMWHLCLSHLIRTDPPNFNFIRRLLSCRSKKLSKSATSWHLPTRTIWFVRKPIQLVYYKSVRLQETYNFIATNSYVQITFDKLVAPKCIFWNERYNFIATNSYEQFTYYNLVAPKLYVLVRYI